MNLWLILPIKPFTLAKSRLAPRLSTYARATLSKALAERLLAVTNETRLNLQGVIISRDRQIASIAKQSGLHYLKESGSELNQALAQGRDFACTNGADAVLVLPTDLPLITTADVRALYQLGEAQPGVVIAGSLDGGTNALLLRPPEIIPFAFGEDSFAEHQRLAQQAGVTCTIYDSDTIRQDLDTPDHLALLRGEYSKYYSSSPQACR